jgi:hypothetical protein
MDEDAGGLELSGHAFEADGTPRTCLGYPDADYSSLRVETVRGLAARELRASFSSTQPRLHRGRWLAAGARSAAEGGEQCGYNGLPGLMVEASELLDPAHVMLAHHRCCRRELDSAPPPETLQHRVQV